jgi:hypothetical protein
VRLAAILLVALAALAAFPVAAQTVVTSPGPARVSVTLYRNPDRGPGGEWNLDWLLGFALVTETRTITLSAGEAEVRFEGVAGGILPQSAIVAGFPDGIVERNRDAYLLSPATLVDRSLGQRVMLRRTSRATGATTETEAILRSGADGAVVMQTAEGNEALRCTGLTETVVYNGLPAGLAARPTLSVRTRASGPVTATVTLAYLASGFDWQANYIANLSADGTSVDLLAWLTLGSSDETSFLNANTQAVAGRVNHEAVEQQPREGGPLNLRCWPAATTSDIPLEQLQRMAMGRGAELDDEAGMDVVVTGSRMDRRAGFNLASPITAITAQQEALGDLKLYRIPEPVTLAARSQKQVAFMNRQHVRVRFVYRLNAGFGLLGRAEPQQLERFLITRNRTAEGLGEPLPAGQLVLFGAGSDRPILLGEGMLGDRAIGEDVEVSLGASPSVYASLHFLSRQGKSGRFALVVTNAQPRAAAFEAGLGFEGFAAGARLERRNGQPLWRVTVPANGRAVLCFGASVSGLPSGQLANPTEISCPRH